MDVGKAVLACTDPTLREHTPGPEYGWDADGKSYGWDGVNLLMWRCGPELHYNPLTLTLTLTLNLHRWLCATGVYVSHSPLPCGIARRAY